MLLTVELSKHELTQLSTLQTMDLYQVQEIIQPYRMSKLENQALVMACGVKPYQFEEISRIIGCGKNTQTGETLNNSVLDLETSWHIQDGVRLPKCMHAVIPNTQCKRRIQWKILEDNALVKYSKFQFQIIHTVYNIRMYFEEEHQLVLSHLNTAFIDAVFALPNTSIEEGNAVKREYIEFLNKHGERIIVNCEFGGIAQGEVHMDKTEFINIQSHLDMYIHTLLDMLETGTTPDAIQLKDDSFQAEARIFEIFDKTILKWKGGEACGNFVTLNSLTTKQWSRWIHTLFETPKMLCNHAGSIPIHQFVLLISNDISIQVKLACANIYENLCKVDKHDKLVPESILGNLTRESAARNTISKTIQRANIGFPDTSTIIQGTNENYTTRLISEINVGDRVLCKSSHGSEFKEVLEVNCSQKGRTLDYIYIKHQYGELLIGYNHCILQIYPIQSRVLAKNIQIGSNLIFIDKNRTVLESQVTHIGTRTGIGRYFLRVDNASADLAVDQVLIGDIQTCFPGNATVLLRGGKRVRMDELKIGDYVLSIHPTTFKPVYSKVYLWAHRDIHNTTTFLHITHPHGHLHISANHLILSGDDKTPIPAHQLRVGDSIHFMSHSLLQKKLNGNDKMDSHSLIPVSVLQIHSCIQVGYYSPFTDNGLVVVDNIATSVYSQIPVHSQSGYTTRPLIHKFGMHAVAHCVLTPVRVGCKLGMRSLLSDQIDENSHIHKYCRWLLLHC